jgi:hypothetical protein
MGIPIRVDSDGSGIEIADEDEIDEAGWDTGIKDYKEDGMFAYMDNRWTINETIGSKKKAGKGSAACTMTAPTAKGKATCVKANQRRSMMKGVSQVNLTQMVVILTQYHSALLYLYLDYRRHFSVRHRGY